MTAINAAKTAILQSLEGDTIAGGVNNSSSSAFVRSGFFYGTTTDDTNLPHIVARLRLEGSEQHTDNQADGGSTQISPLMVSLIVRTEAQQRDDDQGDTDSSAIIDRLYTLLHAIVLTPAGWNAAPMIWRAPLQPRIYKPDRRSGRKIHEQTVRFALTMSRTA